jgi:hypothetical protein
VETPAVRVESSREIAWRVRAERPGRYDLTLRAGGESVTKRLDVGESWGAVSQRRTGASLADMLLWPGEAPLGSGPIAAVEVTYPELRLRLWGFDLHWLAVFLVLSLAAGFAMRGPLGIEI